MERAARHSAFWEQADAVDAVRLHVDMPYTDGENTTVRHLGIYLDVSRLATNRNFRTMCLRELSVMQKPDMVIIPRHSTSETVRQLVGEVFSDAKILLVDPKPMIPELKEALAGTECILIADDGLFSGATLYRLRDLVYQVTQKNPPIVQGFVLVARPEKREAIIGIERRFRDQHGVRFRSGYELYLPAECPWCTERQVLEDYLPRLSEEEAAYAEKRIEKLRGPLNPPLLISVVAQKRLVSKITLGCCYLCSTQKITEMMPLLARLDVEDQTHLGHYLNFYRRRTS